MSVEKPVGHPHAQFPCDRVLDNTAPCQKVLCKLQQNLHLCKLQMCKMRDLIRECKAGCDVNKVSAE